jgi:hypothetical protein
MEEVLNSVLSVSHCLRFYYVNKTYLKKNCKNGVSTLMEILCHVTGDHYTLWCFMICVFTFWLMTGFERHCLSIAVNPLNKLNKNFSLLSTARTILLYAL